MVNPVQIERRYHELKGEVHRNPSSRASLQSIHEFLELLYDDEVAFESYFIELAAWLPPLEDPLSFTGIDPAVYDRLYRSLRSMETRVPAIAEMKRYRQFMRDLQHLVALQYAFVGEPLASLDILGCELSEAQERHLGRWEKSVDQSPWDKLRSCIEQVREVNRECAEMLKRLEISWEKCRNPSDRSSLVKQSEFSVLIPTVVQQETEMQYSEGRLRRLSIELFDLARDGTDRMTASFDITDTESGDDKLIRQVTDSVRTLLQKTHPRWAGCGFRGRFSYARRGWSHQGRSMQLGAAGLLYGSVLDHAGFRKRYSLRPAVALTGLVDGQGNVKRVEDAGLKAKVKAAFFSWADILVVPGEQRERAMEYRSGLTTRYPGRSLEILGVERLQDLFNDRRVTRYQEDSVIRHYGKRLWRHKWSTAGILLILVLSAISFRLLYGPLDRNPVSADVAGNEFLVKNASGQIIERLPAGENMYRLVNNSKYISKRDAILLEDANGDGVNEVFWLEINGVEQSELTWLHARDLNSDEKLWSRPLTYSFDFPHKRNPLPNLYRGMAIRLMHRGEQDSAHLVVASHHKTYFPSVVERIHALSGKPGGKYLHPGYLRSLKLIDFDGNGRKEIVVGGENNSWHQAVVSVLDPHELSGHAPRDSSYDAKGIEKAHEIAYWRFPPTHLEKAYDRRIGDALVSKIDWIRSARQIQVDIQVRNRGKDLENEGKPGFIQGFFNYHFKLLDVGTHNFYDRMVEQLKQRDSRYRHTHFYGRYFEAYADSLLYWNGAGWQHTPAVNPDYLRVRSSIRKPSFERKPGRASKRSTKVRNPD